MLMVELGSDRPDRHDNRHMRSRRRRVFHGHPSECKPLSFFVNPVANRLASNTRMLISIFYFSDGRPGTEGGL
jgi:hypothetical protein